jgi:lactoylglutathione lyase
VKPDIEAGMRTGGEMLKIQAVNHVGIRVRDNDRSVAFYEGLGFELQHDAGFEQGHPIIIRHPSGVVINLLGPTTLPDDSNVLMDTATKHAGITHVALTIESIEDARTFMADRGIEITGSFSFGEMSAIFVRDPDRNVIELDAYDGQSVGDDLGGYSNHPG